MDKMQRERDRSRRGDRPSRFSDAGGARDRSGDRKQCTRLYVSNIPYDVHWSDLKDLFKEKVGDVAFVELLQDENGKSRGCATVEFTNPDATKKAMEVMHWHQINGRKLVMKEDFGGDRSRAFKQSNSRPSRDDKDKSFGDWNRTESAANFNTYGLSTQFLDSINVQPPLVKKVFVANLDYKVDQSKLKEIFKMAGKVRNIDLSLDKEGKSRGLSVIEYDHPVEAVQAISMFDRQMLYDRRITVRMDRADMGKPTELRLPEGLKSIGLGLGPNGEPLRDVAKNLPNQSQNAAGSTSGVNASLGAGIMGVSPAANVALNGLGAAGIGAAGLATNSALSSTALGLQALGITGLGALQNQLLQSGITGDLAGNIASALTAQQQLGLTQMNNPSVSSLGELGGGRASLGGGMGIAGNGSYGSGQGNLMSNSSMVLNSSNSDYGRSQNDNMGSGGRGMGNVPLSVGSFGGRGDSHHVPANDRQPASSDMVVVSNLPPTVTWQLLREKFSECGDVKFAEITSKDTAIVRFHKVWDAERSVKMFDRTRIDGRTIEVRFF